MVNTSAESERGDVLAGRWRLRMIIIGLALAVLGVAWYLVVYPLVWQVHFDFWYYADYTSSPPDDLTSFSRGAADGETSTDWRLQLPLWLLISAGAATIAVAAVLPGPFRAQPRTDQLRALGIGGVVLGLPMVLLGAIAPDPNGWNGIVGSYQRDVWAPVLLLAAAAVITGAVLIIVSARTSPESRARASAAAEARERTALQAQAARITQYEAAYALAHDGQAPPPGSMPIAIAIAPVGRTNTLAVLSFVLTLLAAGFMGLILGPIALRQIRQTGENGRGLAIASIVIAAAYVTVIISLVIVALLQ